MFCKGVWGSFQTFCSCSGSMWNCWCSISSTESAMYRLLNNVGNGDYPERFNSFQPTMTLGRTAHQHCCTPYDTYYRLITNVYVCNVNIALHTMACLDDEYQDLEEVIIWYYRIVQWCDSNQPILLVRSLTYWYWVVVVELVLTKALL